MLSFGAKNVKTHFLKKKSSLTKDQPVHCVHVNSVMHQTRLKSTQIRKKSEETDFLRISKKSHFPKTDYRF